MSVTFAPAIDPDAPVVWFLECADGVRRDERTGSYTEVAGRIEPHTLTCEDEDCRIYGPSLDIVGDGSPAVNMTNVNARLVLDALGLPFEDGTGALDAEDFWGRVLMALAIAPEDAGMPRHQLVAGDVAPLFGEVREGGATFIECGRREGYLQDKLRELVEVARWASTVGREVTWA